MHVGDARGIFMVCTCLIVLSVEVILSNTCSVSKCQEFTQVCGHFALLYNLRSLCLGARMRSKACGSHFVCSERICFFRRLWAKVSISTAVNGVFSKFLICRFVKQSFVLGIWQYLLTSKAVVSAYDSFESKAILCRLPFSLKYRTAQ